MLLYLMGDYCRDREGNHYEQPKERLWLRCSECDYKGHAKNAGDERGWLESGTDQYYCGDCVTIERVSFAALFAAYEGIKTLGQKLKMS